MGATTLLLVSLLAARHHMVPDIGPTQFAAWFEEGLNTRSLEDAPADEPPTRFVLITGLGNERMPGYFRQNIKGLSSLGIDRTDIHVIEPSSSNTLEENQKFVRDQLKNLVEGKSDKIVLVGHSRGACDAMLFALRNPRFVGRHVRAMFLIQGPFGGSGLADLVLSDDAPSMKALSPPQRALGKVLSRRERRLVERGRHAGLADLTREESARFWEDLLDERKAAAWLISPRVYYIQSALEPDGLRLFQRTMGQYLDEHYGPNDGMVSVEDQILPSIGQSLGIIGVGHADLTRRFPAGRPNPRYRKALAHAIVRSLESPQVNN